MWVTADNDDDDDGNNVQCNRIAARSAQLSPQTLADALTTYDRLPTAVELTHRAGISNDRVIWHTAVRGTPRLGRLESRRQGARFDRHYYHYIGTHIRNTTHVRVPRVFTSTLHKYRFGLVVGWARLRQPTTDDDAREMKTHTCMNLKAHRHSHSHSGRSRSLC